MSNDDRTTGKKYNGDQKNGFLPLPILLQIMGPAVLGKDQYLTMKLRSVLTVDKSPTYDLVVPYFIKWYPQRMVKIPAKFESSICRAKFNISSTKVRYG